MPYSSISELPSSVRGLPEHAQVIFQRAFNAAYIEYGKDEERAFRVAWSAVKKRYREGEDGTWHTMSSNSISFNRINRADVGDFWKYPDVVVTKRGVMRGKYKSNEMIDTMYCPKVLPIVVDHTETEYPTGREILELPEIGIGINMRLDTMSDEHKIVYDFYIPKELVLTNDRMEDGELNEVSVVYSPECDKLDTIEEYNGTKYNSIEKSKRLYHVAVMDVDYPACSLKDGCGMPQCGCNNDIKPEVNNMDETETPEQLEIATEPETPETPVEEPQSETVEEPTQEEEEATVEEPVVDEPPVAEPPAENKTECPHIEVIATLNKEIVGLKAKIEELKPGHDAFIENNRVVRENTLNVIKTKIPTFNDNGMSNEQLGQVAVALNKEEADKIGKKEGAKLLYSQMNSTDSSANSKKIDYAELNAKINRECGIRK